MRQLLCRILGHRRDRSGIWHDSLDLRTQCRRCGAPMILDHQQQRWRPFRDRHDGSPYRMSQPERATTPDADRDRGSSC